MAVEKSKLLASMYAGHTSPLDGAEVWIRLTSYGIGDLPSNLPNAPRGVERLHSAA